MFTSNIATLFFNRTLIKNLSSQVRKASTYNQHIITTDAKVSVATLLNVASDMPEAGETYEAYIERSKLDILNIIPQDMHEKPLIFTSSAATVIDAAAFEKAKATGDIAKMKELSQKPLYVGHTTGAVGIVVPHGNTLSVIKNTGMSFLPGNIIEGDEKILSWFFLNRTNFQTLVRRGSFQTLSFIDLDVTSTSVEQIQANIQKLKVQIHKKERSYDKFDFACGHAMYYALTGTDLGPMHSAHRSHGKSILEYTTSKHNVMSDEVKGALIAAIKAVGLDVSAELVEKQRVIGAAFLPPQVKP